MRLRSAVGQLQILRDFGEIGGIDPLIVRELREGRLHPIWPDDKQDITRGIAGQEAEVGRRGAIHFFVPERERQVVEVLDVDDVLVVGDVAPALIHQIAAF